MADPNDNSNNEPQPLVLEEVVDVAPEDLDDDQKTFIQENADDLSDEQKETFKDVIEEEEEPAPEDVEPETRTKPIEKPEKKEEEEEEVDPDDEAAIGKVVDKRLGQVTEDLRTTKDQMEVDAFIRDNPDYSKYRTLALKYMKNSAYGNIPAHNIMAIVAGKDQQKIGAKKEREAEEKAKDTQGGGTSVRKPKGGGVDWGKASTKEVDAKKAEIFDRR